MQLQTFLEVGKINARQFLERLRDQGDPTIPFELDLATVYRHARGQRYPSPAHQSLYFKATAGLVAPEDWLALFNDKSLGIPSKKRAEAQAA